MTLWKIVDDGIYTYIVKEKDPSYFRNRQLVYEEVDNIQYFASFNNAKKSIIKNHQIRINDFKEAIKSLRQLRKSDVQEKN